ncbi:SUKH-3 domain-containing protein [Streptomyces sp. NPDC048650]|uniref:SUKH-3 domain-containing protein n=1 Tax=unclassified Streptomyces TaxID=2593676 RepID=UPI00371FDEA3
MFEVVGLAMHDAAEVFLRELGGLAVNVGGSGISCACTSFELDPELAWGEDDRLLEWGEFIGRRLFPLGELDHGRFFLAIDEGNEVYLVETWVAGFGPVPRALENLVRAVAPRRIDEECASSGQGP